MQLPLPPSTRYDQAARYLLHKAGALLFLWLLRLTAEQLRFERWLPTQLTLPNLPQRLCDGVAELADLQRGGQPFAALLEVQTQPDPLMPGRLMLAGGLLWLTVKPTSLPGDRYELLGVILNLTGIGDATRHGVLGNAEWTLRPVEVNLETRDAEEVLEEIANGVAPRELLAFVPLMHRGGEAGIIQRWRDIVRTETDPHRRGDYSLARVFAERVGRREAWENAMEEVFEVESPLIAQLLAGAETKGKDEGILEGKREGKLEGKIETLLRLARKSFQELPEEVARVIRSCKDSDQLDRWLDAVVEADNLAEFRRQTGL